jgi:glycosyltransferase involved in cell wall biosynthesis
MSLPIVSVIIPCRNEVRHIRACLESIAQSQYPSELLDVIVIDGMSDDGTRDVLQEFADNHSLIRVLDNPRLITPAALNIGIAAARGSVVMRMDAHSSYPPEYILHLVRWLDVSGAENVGGACLTEPANDSLMARAIAKALSHPFGVGNSHFRLGVTEPRWVDTVPFGCYRRSVFERIGGFDEDLTRNQDDEFNARLRRAGGRILLVPDVSSNYIARATLGKLWRMYYQYGLFKPLAVRKAMKAPTLRQLAPAAFVLVLALTTLLAFVHGVGPWPLIALLVVYGVSVCAAAGSVARCAGARVGLASIIVFPVLHFSYGLGYLLGLAELTLLRATSKNGQAVPLTR